MTPNPQLAIDFAVLWKATANDAHRDQARGLALSQVFGAGRPLGIPAFSQVQTFFRIHLNQIAPAELRNALGAYALTASQQITP